MAVAEHKTNRKLYNNIIENGNIESLLKNNSKENYKSYLNYKNEEGMTLLMIACKLGKTSKVEHLLKFKEKGLDINKLNEHTNMTAFGYACFYFNEEEDYGDGVGKPKIPKLLKEAGADTDLGDFVDIEEFKRRKLAILGLILEKYPILGEDLTHMENFTEESKLIIKEYSMGIVSDFNKFIKYIVLNNFYNKIPELATVFCSKNFFKIFIGINNELDFIMFAQIITMFCNSMPILNESNKEIISIKNESYRTYDIYLIIKLYSNFINESGSYYYDLKNKLFNKDRYIVKNLTINIGNGSNAQLKYKEIISIINFINLHPDDFLCRYKILGTAGINMGGVKRDFFAKIQTQLDNISNTKEIIDNIRGKKGKVTNKTPFSEENKKIEQNATAEKNILIGLNLMTLDEKTIINILKVSRINGEPIYISDKPFANKILKIIKLMYPKLYDVLIILLKPDNEDPYKITRIRKDPSYNTLLKDSYTRYFKNSFDRKNYNIKPSKYTPFPEANNVISDSYTKKALKNRLGDRNIREYENEQDLLAEILEDDIYSDIFDFYTTHLMFEKLDVNKIIEKLQFSHEYSKRLGENKNRFEQDFKKNFIKLLKSLSEKELILFNKAISGSRRMRDKYVIEVGSKHRAETLPENSELRKFPILHTCFDSMEIVYVTDFIDTYFKFSGNGSLTNVGKEDWLKYMRLVDNITNS
jgi:hypothetical protein